MAEGLIKTARRVFEVLELFEQERRALRLKDVAQGLDCPVSSASALLKTMSSLGYLDYDRASRTYMPTTRLSDMSSWVEDVYFADGRVIGMLEALRAGTGLTVAIATESDLTARYVHVAHSADYTYTHTAGSKRSLAYTGIGWLFLSAKPDPVIDNIVRRINIRFASKHRPDAVAYPFAGRIDPALVMRKVREIRRKGHVFAGNTVVEGAAIIGRLLPPNAYSRMFAVTVHGDTAVLEAREAEIIARIQDLIHAAFPGA